MNLGWLANFVLADPARQEYKKAKAAVSVEFFNKVWAAYAEFFRAVNEAAAKLMADPANWKKEGAWF